MKATTNEVPSNIGADWVVGPKTAARLVSGAARLPLVATPVTVCGEERSSRPYLLLDAALAHRTDCHGVP